ncbi:MAG: ferric reductase-like transmembrane domain-containing protein [Acidimicrobiales bacterium]|nr:ferric reductase-like transmembrane domain-containing protein [Acidimicrobiales bacterium]
MNGHFWWYASRSTGLVAWGAAAASVIWGLLLSTRSARGLAKPAWVLDLHRWLAVLTLVATGAHLGSLVADSYVHFGLADLLVPMASGWKPVAVAWGIVAFWLLVVVEVSSLVKPRIPHKLWARLHLLSFVAYVLATVHYLQAGTESTNAAVLLTVEVVTGLVLFLTLLRILAPRGGGGRKGGSRIPEGARRAAARPADARPAEAGSDPTSRIPAGARRLAAEQADRPTATSRIPEGARRLAAEQAERRSSRPRIPEGARRLAAERAAEADATAEAKVPERARH